MFRNAFWVVVASLAAAAACATPSAAQAPGESARAGRVDGVVVNAETGEPVPAATVRILGLGRNELSHQDGTFHFERLPAGTYRIAAQRVGYALLEQSVLVEPGRTAEVRLALSPTAITLSGIVVTGVGRARSAADAYRPTSVLGDAELRRRLSSSIAATLAHEPGITQRYNGPAASQPVIRGLSGDRVLVLEDGQRTGDIASTSADHAVTIEPLTAERIEVLRGPAGLLYGSNALGGVINVVREEVPRTLPEALTGTVSSQVESVNRGFTAGGSALAAVRDFALRGELSGRVAGDTRTPLGVLPATEMAGYNAGAGVSWVREGGFAGVAVRDYSLEYGVPGSFRGEVIPGAHEEGVTIDLRRSAVRTEAAVFGGLGPFSSLEWDGQFTRFVQEEIEESGAVGTAFGQLTASTGVMANHEHPVGGLRVEGTVGAHAQWLDHGVSGAAGSRPARELSLAGFAVEELAWNRFRLQVGGRYDWIRVTPLDTRSGLIGEVSTRDFGAVSGSFAALLDPAEGLTLGASVSRAFRTPSISELFSNGPHLADYSFNVGNPQLEAEYGLGVDLFARVRRTGFNGEAAVYRNKIHNYIFYAPTGRLDPRLGRFPLYQAQGADALLQGAEGHFQWEALDRVVLDASASYVHGTRVDGDEPLPAIPPLHGSLEGRYDAERYFLTLGWEGAGAQKRTGEFESPTDGYSLWNTGAGLRWTGWGNLHTLTLQVRNLLNEAWYDHLSRIREVAPQPGRNVELLYRVSF